MIKLRQKVAMAVLVIRFMLIRLHNWLHKNYPPAVANA